MATNIEVIGSEPASLVGHTSVLSTNNLSQFGITVAQTLPRQVVGLIPLVQCDTAECRDICGDGWRNPVFGDPNHNGNPSYENDWNTFLVDVSLMGAQGPNIQFELEKFEFGSWGLSAVLDNPVLGNFYGIATVPGHPTYVGYALNWGAVLNNRGPGCYRVKVRSQWILTYTGIPPGSEPPTSITVDGCLQSPAFELLPFDCFRAHGTVKFETWLTGVVGDPYEDYLIHDVCDMWWYDSIRVRGFFGYQKSPEYKTNNLEWGSPFHGKIEKVSDEQIQRWQYLSKYMPQYVHTRFSTFAMMSDRLFGSDYNINNSDYTIKRKCIVYDSGYEPEYIDKEAFWQRKNKAKVEVFFKRGVQSVIKSICCPTRLGT